MASKPTKAAHSAPGKLPRTHSPNRSRWPATQANSEAPSAIASGGSPKVCCAILTAGNWSQHSQPALIPNPAAHLRDAVAWCWAEASHLDDMAAEFLAEGSENSSIVGLFYARLSPILGMLQLIAERMYSDESARTLGESGV